MITGTSVLDDIHDFCFPKEAAGQPYVSFTFMNLNSEAVVFYLLTLANRQNRKHNESLADRQMCLFNRQITRNTFATKKRSQIFVRTLHKLFSGLHESFGFHGFKLSFFSFVSMS